MFAGAFATCSKTLTSLELDFLSSWYFFTFQRRSNELFQIFKLRMIVDSLPLLLPRRSIFLLCRISKASPFLTVYPHIEFLDVPGSSDNNYRSSLPALIELVKTPSLLQPLVLDFVFRGVTCSTLTYRQWPYSRILPLPFVRSIFG